jgi:hypothetical protein
VSPLRMSNTEDVEVRVLDCHCQEDD